MSDARRHLKLVTYPGRRPDINAAPDPDVGDLAAFGYSVSMLGRPLVSRNGDVLSSVLELDQQALAFYLLRMGGEAVERRWLARLLWSDGAVADSDTAMARLASALERIEQALPGLLDANENTARARLEAIDQIDANELELIGNAPDAVPHAVLLRSLQSWRGPFLDAFVVSGAEAFDRWARSQRDQLRGQALRVAAHLASVLTEPGERIRLAQLWIRVDDTDEHAHRIMMNALADTGRMEAAMAHYERLRAMLQESLGHLPVPETAALYRRLRDAAALPRSPRRTPPEMAENGADVAPTTALNPSADSASNVTRIDAAASDATRSMPLIGRDRELAEIATILQGGRTRLLTVLGPGGIGKTWLGRGSASRDPQALAFVSLAGVLPTSDEDATDQLALQIGQGLGFDFKAPHAPAKLMLNYLSGMSGLLFIDNFDHFLAAREFIAELLQRAPKIRVLLTSRERLGLAAESVYELHGLERSDLDDTDSLRVESSPAFQLFATLAKAVEPRFDARAERAAIIRIVNAVDGSPLGIELAANWVRALPCIEIARRIDSDLDLLTSTNVDADPRHQSMRAVLESSWVLLTSNARRSFAALSVFHGGCTAQAAREVAGIDALDLAGLASRSWIKPDATGTVVRYSAHPLLRQFGQERMAGMPALRDQIRAAHATYFRDQLLSQNDRFGRFDVAIDIPSDPDRENLRAAWQWLVDHGGAAELAPFVGAMHTYLLHAGRLKDAVTTLEQALQLRELEPSLQMFWQRLLSQDQWQLGRLRRSAAHAKAVLSIAGDELGDDSPRGWSAACLDLLAHGLGRQRDRTPAGQRQQIYDRVFALARLSTIGFLRAEDPAVLIRYTLRASELSRVHGLTAGRMWSNAYFAVLLRALRQQRLADIYSRRAAGFDEAVGNDSLSAHAMQTLGIESFIAARWDLAVDMLARCARCYGSTGEWRLTMDAAAVTGLVEIARGHCGKSREYSRRLIDGGRRYGDRITELWGWLESAEAAVREGGLIQAEWLENATRLADAGTVHEHARRVAVEAKYALQCGDRDAARVNALQAVSMLGRSRYLPFYVGEACVLTADALLQLVETLPRSARWLDDNELADGVVRSVAIVDRFAQSNRFIGSRAQLLIARKAQLEGRHRAAARARRRALRDARALVQRYDLEAARQAIANEI